MTDSPREPFYWLNKDSRDFLRSGYLLPGVTPEQRVRQIAERAEEILRKPGFADKFYDYMSRGWYSLSSPVWSNFGMARGLPISCVTGDTWVNTKSGGGKQAADIEVGDEVLTHKGRYRRVTNIMKTENRSGLYKLRVKSRLTALRITGDHLVLTNLGWVRADELDPLVHLVAVNDKVEVAEKGHVIDMAPYVTYPYVEGSGKLYKKGENARPDRYVEVVSYYSAPNRHVEVDEDLAWAIGAWFADGSLTRDNKKSPNGIRLTVGRADEVRVGDKWLEIITNKFGLNGNKYVSEAERNGKTHSWVTYNVNSGVIGELFSSFGNGAKDKTLPDWATTLPLPETEALLRGIMEDGSYGGGGMHTLTLSNPKLLLQVYQLTLRLGLTVSLQMQAKAGKLSTTRYVYTMRIYGLDGDYTATRFTKTHLGIKFKDGLRYAGIDEITPIDDVETVYDFTVEEDHSFSVAGVVVHNCFSSYVPDSMHGIFDTASEVAMMSKHGGGTAVYLGALRPRGAPIQPTEANPEGENGQSEGAVHFAQLFETTMKISKQGAVRRGSTAVYLPIEHPDIMEFLDIRTDGNPIQELQFAVTVTDDWMQAMIDGDRDKRKTWAKVLQKRSDVGSPYITFIDNVNRGKPQVYHDKDMDIVASNLCVTGDQLVPTSNGTYTVKELADSGEHLVLWDGHKTVKASPMRLIHEQVPVIRVTLSSGLAHTVTPDHKIKTSKGMVRADEINLGDEVYVNREPYHAATNYISPGAQEQVDADVPGARAALVYHSNGSHTDTHTVVRVEYAGIEDVYCTTVDSEEHVWVANGFVTSNCNEVMLPSSEDESFVCCLSSMNLYHYEEWEGTDAVQVLTYFLDAVMSEFIEKAKDIPHFHRAVRFAERHRALGLGVLGYHSFLQSKSIPFDTFEATVWNARIFRYLEAETNKATESLARLLGEPELLKGYGRRNTTTMALAPTTSSSFILGQVSQSIEPLRSNYFIKDLAKSKTVYQNPELKRVLSEKYGRDEEAVWESILQAGGSVQHLAFMDDHDKAVFKTFAEISPMDIVQQAGQRQKWIDQGQSLNLMIHPDMPTKDVNQVYIEAWRQGVKGLYYQHSFNAAQEYTREMLECSACAA